MATKNLPGRRRKTRQKLLVVGGRVINKDRWVNEKDIHKDKRNMKFILRSGGDLIADD